MKNYLRKIIGLLPEKVERKYYEEYFEKEHKDWLTKGKPLPVSNINKQKMLRAAQLDYQVENFVETGTYLGDTLFSVYPYFNHLYSIELSPFFYKKAKKRFSKLKKIELLQGDSGKVLKHLLPRLSSAAIFWLDGHYSGGLTALGDKECPVFEELQSIFLSPFQHLIFIDDARLFVGKNDYPAIEEMKAFVQAHKPGYLFSIDNDCIQLLPV